MLIPSTITARRTRRYTSTWYIHPTTNKHDFKPMDGRGRYIFQPPQCQAVNPSRWSTLPPPFTDRLLPLYGLAAEGAGPVVEAPGDPDAQALGGAAALPAHDRLQVVNSLDHPYDLLRLHQVEGDVAAHLLSLGG